MTYRWVHERIGAFCCNFVLNGQRYINRREGMTHDRFRCSKAVASTHSFRCRRHLRYLRGVQLVGKLGVVLVFSGCGDEAPSHGTTTFSVHLLHPRAQVHVCKTDNHWSALESTIYRIHTSLSDLALGNHQLTRLRPNAHSGTMVYNSGHKFQDPVLVSVSCSTELNLSVRG